MATRSERFQQLYHQHQEEHGGLPDTTYNVVKWAMSKGLLEAPSVDPASYLAEDMARALREEYRTDAATGHRYRVNHAARITKDGVQLGLWGELERSPREFMVKAFAQRRAQIVGDCFQLRVDVDIYNGLHADVKPIQLVLDFSEDVEERFAASLTAS